MTQEDKIWLATKAADKGWDYETLKYSDHLYNEDDDVIDDIWPIVVEYKEKGSTAFREQYKDYKLY